MDLTREEVALIEAHRAAQAAAETWEPTSAASVPVDEKAAAFDRLHGIALDIYLDVITRGYHDEDADHWCFEAVLELLGKGVWGPFNKALR